MGDLYLSLSELLEENSSFKNPPDISQSQGKTYDSLSKNISDYLINFCDLVEKKQDPDGINKCFSSLSIPILSCTNISTLLKLYDSLSKHHEIFPDASTEKFYIESRCNLLINTKPDNQNFEHYLISSVANIRKMRENNFGTRGIEMMFTNYCFQIMEDNLNNITSHRLAKEIKDIIDPMDFKRFRKLEIDLRNSPINKELNKQDFKILNEIYSNNQKGNFLIKVHEGIWLNSENEEVKVAIKIYKFNSKDEKNERYKKMIDTEFEILQKINAYDNEDYDEHFVKFYGYVKIDEEDNFEYWVVMELYEETLMSYIRNNYPLSDKTVLVFAKKLLEGLVNLHEKNIAHLDIKPQNIFVKKVERGEEEVKEEEEEEEGEGVSLKIADFNISLDLDKEIGPYYPVQGTTGFMAPELESAYYKLKVSSDFNSRKTLKYDPKKADVASLGLTLCQCLRGNRNECGFSWKKLSDISDIIKRQKKNTLCKTLDDMLKIESIERLDASRVLRKLNGEEDIEESKEEEKLEA